MKQVSIGIDIGGTNTAIGIVDRDGNILYEKLPQIPTPQKKDNLSGSYEVSEQLLNNFITLLADEIQSAIDVVSTINPSISVKGIGIGAPNANYYSGTIEHAPNLPFIGIIPFAKLVQDKFPEIKTVKLTNDANAAALGEMIYGDGKEMKNFVMITLGTGLGSGLIVNGDLVYGADGFAGEIGHTTIGRGTRLCGCGRTGHLEAYCSATGMKRTVFELLAKYNDTESELANIPFNEMNSKLVLEAAERGDKLAKEVFEVTGQLLGEALADTVHHLSPEAIFLFGGPVAAGDYIFKPTIETMETYLLPIFKNKVKILPSGLKLGAAAILGASALVWKELEKQGL